MKPIFVIAPEDEGDNDYQKVVFRSTIDLCTLSTIQKKSFLAESYKQHLQKSIDFVFSCPFKKVYDLTVRTENN